MIQLTKYIDFSVRKLKQILGLYRTGVDADADIIAECCRYYGYVCHVIVSMHMPMSGLHLF